MKISDEEQKPSLQDLSKQLFALCDDFNNLYDEIQEEDNLSKKKKESVGLWIEQVANLLSKTYSASATASRTQHPAVLGGYYPPEDDFNKSHIFFFLHIASGYLKDVLFNVFEAFEKEEDAKEYGDKLDNDFNMPWQCLVDGYCFLKNTEYKEWEDIGIIIESIEKCANELAGIFFREQAEINEAQIDNSKSIEIPPDRKTTPLSLERMAQYWGGDMTSKKLKSWIDKGRIKVIQIKRV